MYVGSAGGGRGQLGLFLRLFLNLCNLLTLLRRSRDFHAQNDVTNLGLSQGGNIDAGGGGGEKKRKNLSTISQGCSLCQGSHYHQLQITRDAGIVMTVIDTAC